MIAVGSNIGSYVVVRAPLREGSAHTLLARSSTGRLVVLKTPMSNDRALAARLRDQARLGARVYHCRLVETLDELEHEGMPVLVLGFVEGPTLEEMLRQASLDPASAARVGCHIAEALSAIHDALGDDGQPLRALHGDVTARNIVLTSAGDAVLTDVGTAKCFAQASGAVDDARSAHTGSGMAGGMFRSLAPELLDGEAATTASDFYSLGCVIIEACTGPPLSAEAPFPPALGDGLPSALRAIVERLVTRRPQDRIHAAHEVSSALRAVEEALGGGDGALVTRVRMFAAPAIDAAQGGTPAELPLALTAMPSPAGCAPPVDALELVVEPRARAPVLQLANEPQHLTARRAGSFIGDGAKKVLVALILLVGATLAWRWHDGERREADRRVIEQRVGEEAAALHKALADTATDCSGDGGFWLYEDRTGAPVIVDAVGKIPKQYRSQARCVRPVR